METETPLDELLFSASGVFFFLAPTSGPFVPLVTFSEASTVILAPGYTTLKKPRVASQTRLQTSTRTATLRISGIRLTTWGLQSVIRTITTWLEYTKGPVTNSIVLSYYFVAR